ncbi:heme-degrading domain-containing protein [Cellulomonas sp. PhB143]|uniref:heme-degrading domain-containing protein n=1 Tax=Cellulomonas sp. PhB143 TaxID=2485186 RepID=UPI000F498ECD|nr:heme-degrading domain-containing protein [Cellulomonas sp. PhB143]ROS73608.1 uncharacterized protein (UPF0303 family) [Cellulomonas sp. PhB143]
MTDDVAAQIAELEQQERALVLDSFTADDAWHLGCLVVELARERALPIVVDVRRGPQQMFHAALEGSSADNDSWVQRKVRVVERFATSSYLAGLRSRARGQTFSEQHQLPFQEYAAAGGGFPVRVAGVGVVGVLTVSGLTQADDHALVVEALAAFRDTAGA